MSVDLDSAYRQYHPQLLRWLCQRLPTAEDAEDVCSQVFLDAVRFQAAYTDRGYPVSSWLYRIAHSRSIDWWRHQRYVLALPQSHTPDLADGPEVTIPGVEACRMLLQRACLTPEQRQVIHHRILADQSTAMTAIRLGISEMTVKARLHRALGRLRRAVVDDSASSARERG